jgi:hypothetical protein
VREKPIVGFPFFGSFPSDRIPEATKDVNIRIFIIVTISVNCTCQFRELFEETTYICIQVLLPLNKFGIQYTHMGIIIIIIIIKRGGVKCR